jgi:hypothetical protein
MSVLPFPMSPEVVVWPRQFSSGGQVSAVGTLLVFPVVAGWDQRLEEAACEVQAQCQRAGTKATEAHGLLVGALTTIVAQSWDGPVSTLAVGQLIRAERLLARDAIPAIATSRQAAHELAGLMATRECEACDERQAGRGRAAAHGAAS